MTQTIINESGIELIVDFDISPSQIEEGHGYHEVGQLISLNRVEIVISGKGIVLPLTNRQKDYISNLLTA